MEYTYTEMADRYERQYRRGIITEQEFHTKMIQIGSAELERARAAGEIYGDGEIPV
jgi:hypothetical protein